MKKPFNTILSRQALDLENKVRSNSFAWRGQFSPELVENIIAAYSPSEAIVLDPFCGSGSVLSEAGLFRHVAFGVELNPAAYILSKTYELINLPKEEREGLLNRFLRNIRRIFPEPAILQFNNKDEIVERDLTVKIDYLRNNATAEELILLDSFVILLDIYSNAMTTANVYLTLHKLIRTVRGFPYSEKRISTVLGDARALPLQEQSVNFVITSPPYVNVFNYHQNYRRSAELLGWDLLRIAKSEIGSNRANRGNRFLTVIQYCLDMVSALKELHRVCSDQARLVLVVGHESRVLGVPIFNADIIAALASNSKLFKLVLRQTRRFTNKFGKLIREDLLHLEKFNCNVQANEGDAVARLVALQVLDSGLSFVEAKNKQALLSAIQETPTISGTPVYSEVKNYNRASNYRSTIRA